MKMQKNERGITLVALVVTIVVLLILAGITIMYVMSDNGVFGQAREAGQKTDAAAVQEAVSTALVSLYPEVYMNTKTPDENGKIDLTDSFKGNLSASMTPATDAKVTVIPGEINTLVLGTDKATGITVTYKGKDYTVTYDTTKEENLKNGTAGVLAVAK